MGKLIKQLCETCNHISTCDMDEVGIDETCNEYVEDSTGKEDINPRCEPCTHRFSCDIPAVPKDRPCPDFIKDPITATILDKDTRRGLCLQEAFDIINGGVEKVSDDGKPEDSFLTLGEYWGTFLRSIGYDVGILKRSQVCTMLSQLKFARMSGQKYNPDNYRDGCGYTALADYYRKIEEEEEEEAKSKMGEYPDPTHNE